MKLLARGVFHNIKSAYGRWSYAHMMPTNPRADDLFLLEFPKSGVTWLSHIFGNINLKLSGSAMKVTRFNLLQIVCDIHQSRDIPLIPLTDRPGFRMIKSHHTYCPQYLQVLYILRNPFDVMHSYYKFTTQLDQFEGSMTDFIKNREFGIDAWVRHVESWIMSQNTAQRSYYLMKYEDLIADPVATVAEFYSSYGIDLDKEILNQAINDSNLASMRVDEENFRKHNPNFRMEFVRKTDKNSGEAFSETDRAFIRKKAGRILERFYPELLHD